MSLQDFKKLHEQSSPLLLGNIWDAHSAKIAQEAGYKALGSSSHAISNLLGYEDGGNISVDELYFIVERIVKAVKIPVSVDFEAGYSSRPEEVADQVKRLVDIGVVGINLEDGLVENGTRRLGSSDLLVEKIQAIKAKTDVFINARTDTYVTKHADALEESIKRAQHYQKAGADGIFVPLIEKNEDIKSFTEQVHLPLNVFLTNSLAPFDELATLGVKRVSYGAKLYEWLIKQTEKTYSDFKNNPKLPS